MTVMVLVVLMVWALVGTVAILMYSTQPPMGINAAVFIKELIRGMLGVHLVHTGKAIIDLSLPSQSRKSEHSIQKFPILEPKVLNRINE